MAECLHRAGQLCVLWLVGLAIPVAYRFYLVLLLGKRLADREVENAKKGEVLDVAQYRSQSRYLGRFQIL